MALGDFSTYFQPSTNTVNTDTKTFNYNTEKRKVDNRRRAAESLRSLVAQPTRSDYVRSGDFIGYTGSNGWDALAKVAAGVMANKADEQAAEREETLDATSRAALAERLAAMDKRETRPEGVINDADVPVALVSNEVIARPLPSEPQKADVSPLVAALVSRSAPSAGAGRGVVNEKPGDRVKAMEAEEQKRRHGGTSGSLRRLAYVAPGEEPPASNSGASGSWDAPAAPAASPFSRVLAAPAPAAPVQPPQRTELPVPPAAPQQPAPQGTSKFSTEVPQKSVGQQISELQDIARTGPLGEQLAQQQLTQMFGPKANEFEYIRQKIGDNEQVIAVNKRNPAQRMVVSGVPEGAQASVAQQRLDFDQAEAARKTEKERTEKKLTDAKALSNLESTMAGITQLKGEIKNATGASGKFANWVTEKTGIATDSSEARAKLKTLGASLFLSSVDQMRGLGALTEAEGKKLVDQWGALDPDRMSAKSLTSEMDRIFGELSASHQRYIAANGDPRASSQPSAPAAGRAPARGARVTGPESFGL